MTSGEFPAEAAETHIAAILKERDLSQTSLKEVRAELEKRLGVSPGSLDAFREDVKEITTRQIQKNAQTQQETEREASPAPAAGAPAAADTKGKKRKSGPGGQKQRQAKAMTRDTFKSKAKSLAVQVEGNTVPVLAKVFSTGSCGFWGSSKLQVDVGGELLTVQCQIQAAIIGSKEWDD